jgi:acid phosphatase
LVGDDYNDFTYMGKATVAQRNKISGKQQDKWGKVWFILPGPTYGSYENALLDYNHSISGKERLQKKMKHLKTDE